MIWMPSSIGGSRLESRQGRLPGILIAITPSLRGFGWLSPGGDLGDYRRSTLMSVIPQQAAATAWLAVGVSRVPTDEIANAIARCAGGVVHEVDVAITTSGSSQAFRSVDYYVADKNCAQAFR